MAKGWFIMMKKVLIIIIKNMNIRMKISENSLRENINFGD